jgi:hypothetical protein
MIFKIAAELANDKITMKEIVIWGLRFGYLIEFLRLGNWSFESVFISSWKYIVMHLGKDKYVRCLF